MKIRVLVIALVLAVVGMIPASAQEPVTGNAKVSPTVKAGSSAGSAETENMSWKRLKEYEGIIGYYRRNPHCRIDESKAIGIVEAPVAVVEAVLRDVPGCKDFMFWFKENLVIEVPEVKNTADEYVTYTLMAMPFPVQDRDTVARLNWTVDAAAGIVYCTGQGLDTNYRPHPKALRIPLIEATYALKPVGPDRTEVTYQAMSDPGGYLPAFVINLLSRDMCLKTIAGIRKKVKLEKYRHAAAVVTATPKK
jgi:hypothetical protein